MRNAPRRPVMRSGRPYKQGSAVRARHRPISFDLRSSARTRIASWVRCARGGHRRARRAPSVPPWDGGAGATSSAECPKPPPLPQRRGSSRLTGSRGSMTLGAGRHGEGQRAVRCLRPEGMVRIGRRAHRDSTDEAPCARRACRVLFASAAGGHANECATPY
jgi:hypothetical protein